MANYFRRVAELAADNEQRMTDKDFFESPEYAQFALRRAQDLILGAGDALGKFGYKVTDTELKKRATRLKVRVGYDKNAHVTAQTNGEEVIINAGSSLITGLPTRQLRHSAAQGFTDHEDGHVLFTDFPTMQAWMDRLKQANWWPTAPSELAGNAEAAQMETRMKADENYRSIVCKLAHELQNSMEDGYIENELSLLYPGAPKRHLATLNERLYSEVVPFDKASKEKDANLRLLVFQQILLFAKFRQMKLGDYDGEYKSLLEDCFDTIEDGATSRDPVVRVSAANELLCKLAGLIDEFIDEEEQKQQQGGAPSQGGSGAPQGGQGGQQQISQGAAQAAANAISAAADGAKASQAPVGCTKSIANPNDTKNARASQRVPAADGPSVGQHGGTGASEGESHDAAAGNDGLHQIEKDIATRKAEEQTEEERLKEMQSDAPSDIHITRVCNVDPASIDEYEKLAEDVIPISKGIQRKIMQTLKDRQEGGKISGLPMGRRVEARLVQHDDGKIFSRNKLPTDRPRLGVGLLIDQSGSTSGQTIAAARKTALVVEDFCRGLKLEYLIAGYTTGNSGCEIFSYSEPQKIDAKDKFRLVKMGSYGGTPTLPATEYMLSRMYKMDKDVRLLIVISDGGSASNPVLSNGKRALEELVLTAKRKRTIVVAAGVGSARTAVQAEFPENFLDISDLDSMPTTLCNIIKKHLYL